MATTTLMPLDPALHPQRVNRVLTISADLLPEEVVAARRARRTRGWMLGVVALALVALGGWYAQAAHETRLANDELDASITQLTTLQRRQAGFAEVVDVQSETSRISKQLGTLLANDLPWAALLDELRTTGDDTDVTVSGISGTLTTTTEGQSGAETDALPSTSGAETIGKAIVTGAGPDKPAIAKYVDALSSLRTVANPYVTSVSKNESGAMSFSLNIDITSQALCGRFTTKCMSTGGN
jgi:hypothetical protein